jgi:glycosyltransferase involved in cell wall biosynthesis
LTKNIKVLVYGEWEKQSKNIYPFFTASYSENEEKTAVKSINPNGKIRLLFVGSLVEGKNPLYAIQLWEQLKETDFDVQLDIYGEGPLKPVLQNYIESKNLSERVFFHGNQNQEVLKNAYRQSHFVILPSKSEGWPKAVAEAMFWAAVPVATAVSCVPYMLDYGNRGVLLTMDLEKDARAISELIRNPLDFKNKSAAAMNWSGRYTLERFETEIQKMLQV